MRGAVRCRGWFAWLCAGVLVCGRVSAQTVDVPVITSVDATKTGTPLNLSRETWRFAIGDDLDGKLGWADPAFDDSQWKTITEARPFRSQGYPIPQGFLWLRLHVRMKPGATHQAIAVLQGSYQLFVNGRLLGQQGGMPDHPAFYIVIDEAYPIPADAMPNGSATIAIRVWLSPMRTGLGGGPGLGGSILLGDESLLQNERRANLDFSLFGHLAGEVAAGVALLIALWALALFRAQPEHREYVWLGVFGLCEFASWILYTAAAVTPISIWWGLYAPSFFYDLGVVSFLFFLCNFLRLRLSWPIRIICVVYPLHVLAQMAQRQGWVVSSYDLGHAALGLVALPAFLIPPWLAIRQFRRGDREAGMLLFALLFWAVTYLGEVTGYLLQLLSLRPTSASLIPNAHLGAVPIPALTIGYLIFWISIGAIMLRRSLAITRRQQRTAAELEAARSVQAFLLGREASAPGYTVESAYLPAQEVGGDFFQTIAGPNGSLLAVIGDVAGKGLQAAMRVSMLIGVVRTSPEYSPAALLRKLNGVLLQDGSSGFTTCLVARLDANGTVTIANAGHLSPYINGQELAIDGGLPLGVASGIDYTEQTFPFAAGDKMLLMSDGVVEARNPTGELFGFERMAQTAGAVTAASALAATAQAFGQDDDITVLLLQRAIAPAI